MEEIKEKSFSISLEYPEWMLILEQILERKRKVLKEQNVGTSNKPTEYQSMEIFS